MAENYLNVEIGIDSFASASADNVGKEDVATDNVLAMEEVLQRIETADKVGLDVFGMGEHHRKEYMDSASHMILAAASQRTKSIRLTSAVVVLSAHDPVRVFQNYATLDLLSHGRAEIVAGRGSFIEAFPLFGYNTNDYNALFEEKLDLLLKVRDNPTLSWSGNFRPTLRNQSIYPRPAQKSLPIWRGVGGTPTSFQSAGKMGLSLMVAIIGGETRRFAPMVDVYRRAYLAAGHPEEHMRVGVHSLGYVADTTELAIEEYYPGYKTFFDRIGKERGWSPVTKDKFLFQAGPTGAYLIGSPEDVATKIVRHSKALGGVSRFTFQMDNAGLTQEQILHAIELIGKEVKPLVEQKLQEENE